MNQELIYNEEIKSFDLHKILNLLQHNIKTNQKIKFLKKFKFLNLNN